MRSDRHGRGPGNRAALPLVEALSSHDALAVGINIRAMAVAGRCADDRYVEANRSGLRCGSEYQVQVACVETVDDAAGLFFLRTASSPPVLRSPSGRSGQ